VNAKRTSVKVLFAMFIVLAVCCGCGSSGAKKEVEKPKAPPAISVKSEDILNDYIRDIGTAEQKYKNKNVKITGKVLKKGQFKNSQNFYIRTNAQDVGGKYYSIELDYPVGRIEDVNKLKYGDFVGVEGLCVGMVKQDDPRDITVQIHVGESSNGQVAEQPTQAAQPAQPAATAAVGQPAATAAPSNKIGVITGTDVRVRSGAGTNSKILGYFERGEKVMVLVIQEGWYKVQRPNGNIGWVSADFCAVK
jgi:hypothetical protein